MENLIEGLNPEQTEVVYHDQGPLLVGAVAGSGKTQALIRRVGYLVTVRGVEPSRILAVTFSKSGADEMQFRLNALIGDSGARIGTFHSLALEILKREKPEYRTWRVDDSGRYRICIKEAVGYAGMKWESADINILEHFIELCKGDCARPNSDRALEIAEDIRCRKPCAATDPNMMDMAYEEAEQIRRSRQIICFDDMLLEAVELLQKPVIRRRWASRYDYVLQDEAQDQNWCQIQMGELLAKDHRNYMLVGDPSQCHPPGTKILTDRGEVPIEELGLLSNSDTIKGWNRKAQKMVGGRKFKIARRFYRGKIVDVECNGRKVPMTLDHKVLARWTNREDRKTCVVYLMYRKGFGYRVGWCQLFSSRGKSRNFHLVARAKIEKAEKVWILYVAQDRTDASITESIVSIRYSIPTFTFEPVENAKHITREAINRLFKTIGQQGVDGGNRALRDYGLDPDLPLWPWPEQQVESKKDDEVAYRRGTYFPVYATNILPELMSLPIPDNRNVWLPVSKADRKGYTGYVYSLDVEKDHSYAANGVVVLNCIYSWRGVEIKRFLEFQEQWDARLIVMNRNYRCGKVIVNIANCLLNNMAPGTSLETEMIGERDIGGTVSVTSYADLDEEGDGVAQQIKALLVDDVKPKDIAVLYRTNAQSRAPEESLISAGVPYRVVGSINFYERKEVKHLLSYLRLAANRGSYDDVAGSINSPFRFLGKKFLERVQEEAGDRKIDDWPSFVRRVCDQEGLQRRQRQNAEEWAEIIERMTGRVLFSQDANDEIVDESKPASPASILAAIVHETGYIEWLKRDEGEETPDNSRASNVSEMIRAASRFDSVDDLLDYVDLTLEISKRQHKKGGVPDKVTLCSIHRSKGLEWSYVFIVGVCEKILPHGRCEDIEEERRLFYVGVTRARDWLAISSVRQIAISGNILPSEPSRFLKEIRGHEIYDVELSEVESLFLGGE